MTTGAEPMEPRRQVGHFALLNLVNFMVLASLVLSRRPPTLASVPNVAPIAAIPPRADLAQWRAMTGYYGAAVPRTDWRPPIARLLGHEGDPAVPKLGYAVREWSFLGLPLFAYGEGGYAVYIEASDYFIIAPLSEDGLRQLEQQAGSRFWAGWWFPFWRYSWGLLAVGAVGAWIWLELRWQARRRAILGVL